MSRIAAVSYEHFDKFGFARGKSLASVCFQELYGRLTALMSGRTLWRQDGKPRASDTRSHGHVVQEIGGERTGVPDFASFAYK